MNDSAMKLVKHTSLALVLLSPIAGAHMIAQTPSPKVAQKSTPLPVASDAQETPRAMFERGAFLEEHERDFEAAATLYKQAAESAQSAGDSKTAAEALAARQRVFARLGKPIAPLEIHVAGPGEEDVIAKRIKLLVGSLSALPPGDQRYARAIEDLNQFGAPVVLFVEPELNGMPGPGGETRLDTYQAADVLAKLTVPEARAALERGLQSPDPVLRRTVAEHLLLDRHRLLLEKTASDPVRSVSLAAVNALSNVNDPALLKVMEPAVRAGIESAIRWMAWHAPEKLIDLAFAADASVDIKLLAATALGNADKVPLDVRLARSMLELARSATDDRVRRNMLSSVSELFDRPWRSAPPEIRMQVETEILDHYTEYLFPPVVWTLNKVGGIRTIQFIEIKYWDGLQKLKDEDYGLLERCLQSALGRLEPSEFDALADVYRAWKLPAEPSKTEPPRYVMVLNHLARRLKELASKGVSLSSIVRGFDGLDAGHELDFSYAAAAWMKSAWDESAHAYRKGTVDATMLPLVQYMLGVPNGMGENFPSIQYAEALGDQSLLPTLLFLGSSDRAPRTLIAASVLKTIDVIWSRDPAHARQLIERAVMAGLEQPSDPTRVPIGAVPILPASVSLPILQQLWPRAPTRDDKHAFVRALLAIHGPEATAFLLARYGEIDDDYLRGLAIERFAAELHEPAIPVLGEALKSSDENLRKVTREAFKKFKEYREALDEYSAWMNADKDARASVADLSKLLESPNRDVVIGAVRALAAVKARSALPALVKLLDRPDPELKKAVEEAFAKIGG